ncbi:MAG: GNAT family N-acetyltransferase [Planctomycetota bacterium]
MNERHLDSGGFELRPLVAADAAAYREVRLAGLAESPFAFSESHEDECMKSVAEFARFVQAVGDPPERFTLGAFAGQQLVGFATFARDQRSKARHKGMVYAMYTVADWRGRGVGSAVMKELLRQARRLVGLEQIHLWVLHAETSATPFYQRVGFHSQGTRVVGDLKVGDRYVDAEYMVLRLADGGVQ